MGVTVNKKWRQEHLKAEGLERRGERIERERKRGYASAGVTGPFPAKTNVTRVVQRQAARIHSGASLTTTYGKTLF